MTGAIIAHFFIFVNGIALHLLTFTCFSDVLMEMQRICSLKKELALRIATSLFDVAGATGNHLVLGLQTRKDRDLDVYNITGESELIFMGFRKYFRPKIRELIKSLCRIGISATQDKKVRGVKTMAVETGIGFWGKNSLVIHPTFGPWLRFVVMRTDFDFGSEFHAQNEWRIFEGCANCTKCVDACPRKLLRPFVVIDHAQCLANLTDTNHVPNRRCERCLAICPYGA